MLMNGGVSRMVYKFLRTSASNSQTECILSKFGVLMMYLRFRFAGMQNHLNAACIPPCVLSPSCIDICTFMSNCSSVQAHKKDAK